jgi:hypothetical protein
MSFHLHRRRRLMALVLLISLVGATVLSVALVFIAGASARPAQDEPAGPTTSEAEAESTAPAPRPGRLLVLALPGVSWSDLAGQDLPHLRSILRRAALADLAPRSVSAHSGPGDAYLTVSGGSRATTVREVDGQVLALDEQSTGSAAGEIFERRTGTAPTGPYVSLAWPSLLRANAAQPFETQPGLLTESLLAAGVAVTAIGNADGIDGVGTTYERQVGLAAADRQGVVPDGSLGKDLLRADPQAPFGVRFDLAVVAERFRVAWRAGAPDGARSGGAVLLEASDLARTLRYRPVVDESRYRAMFDAALADTDALVGLLLREVDLDTDTVLVVAPYNQRGNRDLTVVALAGPEVPAGFLRSASTQRSGFLTLVDIAPTILDAFGIARPVKMEGRPAVAVASTDGLDRRIDHLVTLNDASRFREQLLTPTTTVLVLGFAVLIAATIGAHANGWGPRVRRSIAAGGLVLLAILPASYLARALPLEARGTTFYWSSLLLIASAIAGVALLAGRNGRRRGALIGVLGTMALVLVGDVMTGSNLSLSAAFGYSATGNSRLYGISNYSYGQLASAACLVAAWLVTIKGRPIGPILGISAMVATLVVLGVPIWGSDVGGVLAFTPAVAVFAVRATGHRIRLRTLVLGGVATAVAIGAFGLLDLARDPADRGHLGRLFERVGEEGPAPVLSMVERKLAANLSVSTSSLWVLAIPIGLALWVYLRRAPGSPYDRVVASFPTLPDGLLAALVAGVLGTALNDSGAIIGGISALVVASALAVLLLDLPPEQARTGSTDPADEGTAPERAHEAAGVRTTEPVAG